jgi:hypothetical protein
MDLFVTRAAALAHDVAAADSSRAFRTAVHHFEDLLSRISSYPPDFLTDGDARALETIADRVVTRIADRLDVRADRGAVQRELAQQIYQVRRDVENIYLVLRDAPDDATMRA